MRRKSKKAARSKKELGVKEVKKAGKKPTAWRRLWNRFCAM